MKPDEWELLGIAVQLIGAGLGLVQLVLYGSTEPTDPEARKKLLRNRLRRFFEEKSRELKQRLKTDYSIALDALNAFGIRLAFLTVVLGTVTWVALTSVVLLLVGGVLPNGVLIPEEFPVLANERINIPSPTNSLALLMSAAFYILVSAYIFLGGPLLSAMSRHFEGVLKFAVGTFALGIVFELVGKVSAP